MLSHRMASSAGLLELLLAVALPSAAAGVPFAARFVPDMVQILVAATM